MCCRPNLCWSNVSGNMSNVKDTVTTTHSASLSTSTSHEISQSRNLMETQTQLNSPAAYSKVRTTDTNLNRHIHQLVDNILLQDHNKSPVTCSSGRSLSDLSKGIHLGAHVGHKIKDKV